METVRAILTSMVGVVLTGFAFIVAATFGLALIGLVAFAALVSVAAVKLSPHLRTNFAAMRVRRQAPRVWNDGRGVIIDM
jgi:hypothetical protein